MEIDQAHDMGQIYKVTDVSGNTLWVPKDTENNDYINLQQWITDGGVVQSPQ